jgi:hypothetical protein
MHQKILNLRIHYSSRYSNYAEGFPINRFYIHRGKWPISVTCYPRDPIYCPTILPGLEAHSHPHHVYLPRLRRVVATHGEKGVAVVHSDTAITVEVSPDLLALTPSPQL